MWQDGSVRTNASRLLKSPEEVCLKCFGNCNAINVHSQSSQFDLKPEEHWVTQSGHNWIIITLVGINTAITQGTDTHTHTDWHQRIHKRPTVKDCSSPAKHPQVLTNQSNASLNSRIEMNDGLNHSTEKTPTTVQCIDRMKIAKFVPGPPVKEHFRTCLSSCFCKRSACSHRRQSCAIAQMS